MGVASPKKGQSLKPLVELDDPDELGEVQIADLAPDTARPDYASDKFARDVEDAADRMTQPPAPTYDMLRDSCKSKIADEVPLDEEQILRPSSKKYKVTPG